MNGGWLLKLTFFPCELFCFVLGASHAEDMVASADKGLSSWVADETRGTGQDDVVNRWVNREGKESTRELEFSCC